jgi:hypothetical protein
MQSHFCIPDQLNRRSFEMAVVAGDGAHVDWAPASSAASSPHGRNHPQEHTQGRRVLAALDIRQRHHGYADLGRQHLLDCPLAFRSARQRRHAPPVSLCLGSSPMDDR